MKKMMVLMVWSLLLVSLVACQPAITDDVDAKLQHVHQAKIPRPIAKSLPDSPTQVAYTAHQDPFALPVRPKNDGANDTTATKTDSNAKTGDKADNQVKTSDVATTNTNQKDVPKQASMPQNPPINYGKKVSINTNRHRQPLENYALESLSYRGRITHQGRLTALVLDPSGVAHRISVGQYIGQNHGKVVAVSADEIVIDEAVLAPDGQHYHKQSSLLFRHSH